jgi:hypothetical protein
MNQKANVKNAMKGRKMEDLEEHSGWSAATAPMRKPGVSLLETPFAAPARGGIGGFGEAVFRV